MKKTFFAAAVILLTGFSAYRLTAQDKTEHKHDTSTALSAGAPVFKQTIVNIEYQGTRVWVPSFIIVPKGSKVELKLINNTPSGVHGFSIPDFGVKTEVAKGEPKEVSFTADKTGLFPINCHLHPAHIGGQVYVVDVSVSSSEHKH